MARLRRILSSGTGAVGAILTVAVLLIAIFGPALAPHNPSDIIDLPSTGSSGLTPLGTDTLGRDVMSRVLNGGRIVIFLAFAATVLAFLIGGFLGMIAGYTRSLADPLIMRSIDVWLSLPGFLLILILIAGAGKSNVVLVIAVALVEAPWIARVIRAATLETSVKGYVEAAQARGESSVTILRKDLFPAVIGSLLAQFGINYSIAVLLIAGISFLGLGLQPPTADWALMISENRSILELNPYAVLIPAALLGALAVGVNLLGDAIARYSWTS